MISRSPTFRDFWNATTAQFPKSGPKGISYLEGVVDEFRIDALLYRDKVGKIRGVLFHFPMDVGDERAGNVTITVDERFRRRGIGMRLLEEADRRWTLNFDQQDMLPDGRALVLAYFAKRNQS